MSFVSYDPIKRSLDIVASLLGLLASAPLQALLALIIRVKLGPPVLFKQLRPGKDEQIFVLIKFRTMLNEDPEVGPLADEQRLTPFGSFLRSTSLDELPSLWNILKGEMSFVGPRPLLTRYLNRYSDVQRRRHEIRPGLTGLAQVSGRNRIGWEEKLDLDVHYVEHRSFALDARILLRTIGTTLLRRDISAEGQATASEFMGPLS